MSAPPEMHTLPASEVAEIVADARVATTPPSPNAMNYFQDLSLVFGEFLIDFLTAVFGGDSDLWGTFLVWTAYALLGICLAVVIILLMRFVVERMGSAPDERRTATVRDLAPSAPARDPSADLRKALDEGRQADALAALWWWLAHRLLGDAADPAWTSRELVRRAQRRDLLPWTRRLDRMIYGPEVPAIDALRTFWDELRDAADAPQQKMRQETPA